jgi:putative ribosome biogenesis GTPase RsgA
LIADTPGFSALEFNDLTKEEVAKTFLDFKKAIVLLKIVYI